MDDPSAIMREMEGRPSRTGNQTPPRKQKPPRGSQHQSTKAKQPTASERSSVAAQVWYDRGERAGFSFPYNVNYLALALQQKVEKDPRMAPLLVAGEHDKVERWLAKIVANWWDHYVDGSVTSSNAKEMFLGHDWEDVRDWAHSNLRKDYLLKHGKRVEPPAYSNQQEYQGRLEDVHRTAQINRYLASQPEEVDHQPLDPGGRDRLRSFANRRKRSKK